MSTSMKMISTVDPDKSVFITHEAGWKNTRIYRKGKLIESFEDPSELKSGKSFSAENLGNVEIKLHPISFTLSLIVDGEKFVYEKIKSKKEQGMLGVIIVFIILAAVNLLSFSVALAQLSEYIRPIEENYAGSFAIFVLVYTTCAILFGRGYLFFYFVGTVIYLLSTFNEILLAIEIDHIFSNIWIIYIAPRFVIIAILAAYVKRIIKLMRDASSKATTDIIDDAI